MIIDEGLVEELFKIEEMFHGLFNRLFDRCLKDWHNDCLKEFE